ncbi:MAG TPA: hypothetical protein VJ838_12265 [Gaiellaceae bacterium]|nr:hypothetical protein [Gaiellaceae bacterium]
MTEYLYELRDCDGVIATGRISRELPLEAGDSIEIAGRRGIVRAVEPLLAEMEQRLIVQLITG